jgi:hypothetical protein
MTKTTMTDPEERILRRLPLEIVGVALVMAVGSLFFFRARTCLFILIGGLFSAMSFFWLRQTVGRFLGPDRRRSMRQLLGFYLLRLILIIVVFLIIILLFPRMILAFAAGFSSLVPAILAETVVGLSQMRKWKG